jgi:hypothetical protein
MDDFIFEHYLVTTAWTYSHDDFEPIWVGFLFGLPELMVYVSLHIIALQ